MKRLLTASLALAASFSSATLLNVWTKTCTVNSQNIMFVDVAIDNAGNVYGYGYVFDGTKDVVVVKVNAAGATQWTNRFVIADDQDAGHILVDGSGTNLYVTYQYGSSANMRKLKCADGATVGTLTYNPLFVSATNPGVLRADEAGQLYWLYTSESVFSKNKGINIVKVNATLNSSTATIKTFPPRHDLIDTKPRPGGGVIFTAGTHEPGGTDYWDADAYSFDGAVLGPVNPIGMATAFGVLDGKIIGVGGADPGGTLCAGVSTLTGGIQSYQYFAIGKATPIRCAVTTRSGFVAAAGTINYAGGFGYEGYLTRIDNGANQRYSMRLLGTADYESVERLAVDGYFSLYGIEVRSSDTASRLLELDENTGALVNSRTLTYRATAIAGNQPGLVATARVNGGLTLTKPRDLKDIYMGSATITGGNSGTLNIRMYETYGSPRTVNLTDNSTHLTLPASKAIPGAAATASVTVTTTPVTFSEVATITAAFGSQTRTFDVTVNP